MDIARAQQIINAYGATLTAVAKIPQPHVIDLRELPFSKSEIKQAIRLLLPVAPNPQVLKSLVFGYVSLADWQEGVGPEPIGIMLSDSDSPTDPETLKRIAARGSAWQKWRPKVNAESVALASELKMLGF